MTQPVLALNNIRKSFGGVVAIEDFSLTIEPGEIGLPSPQRHHKDQARLQRGEHTLLLPSTQRILAVPIEETVCHVLAPAPAE